jgi:hypothetical protein
MAMDYLPIQASAVLYERVFSSSAKTDTKRRNCISPLLTEALQTLKFHLKKEQLNFTKNWKMLKTLMMNDDSEEDLLHKPLDGDTQDVMDHLIQAISNDED